MASTGKSEIMASIFAIASNNFMQEYHETHLTKPANQAAEAPAPAELVAQVPADEEGGNPKRRNRGNNHGKKKLMDLERVVKRKEAQLVAVASTMRPEEYKRHCKRIDTCLRSKEENLCEKSGKAKSLKLMQHIDKHQAPNTQQ
jgi:hypothetical protein